MLSYGSLFSLLLLELLLKLEDVLHSIDYNVQRLHIYRLDGNRSFPHGTQVMVNLGPIMTCTYSADTYIC